MNELSKIRARIKKFFTTSTYQKLAGLALLLITAVSIPLTIIILNNSTDYQQHAASISRCGANKIGFCTYRPNMDVGAHCPSNTHSISAPPGDCYPLGGALAGLGTVFRAGNDYMCCVNNAVQTTCTCDQQFGLAAYHGGKSPYNHYSCSDGTSGYCGRDEVCGTYTYKPTKPCYTACFKDSDCSNGQSCALGIHQCVTATAAGEPVNSHDACANAHCGNGKYCGGACGNTGDPNTLYDCENNKTASSQSCSNGCQVNSSGPDYCAGGGSSSTSSNNTSQTKLIVDRNECEAVNFGACQFKVPYHLAHVTEDSSGNWTCTDLGYSANCDPNAKSSTATNTPTPTPTITPTPTPAGDVVINVAVKLMGIGLRGNLHPRHIQRRMHIQIYRATDDPSQPNITPVLDLPQIIFTYNSTSGYFGNSHIDLGKKFVSGNYQILVKSPGYLRSEIVDPQGNKVFTLSGGQTSTFPTITLIGGDVSALYNVIDISDFYAIVACFKDNASSSKCTNKDLADLNDDGVVDGVDLNYWLDAMATLQTENKNGNGDGIPGN